MKTYKPEELENVKVLYEGEYFKPIESYKTDNIFDVKILKEKYLISNFGRIYSLVSKKCLKIRTDRSMITFNCILDTLSLIRLVVYNFNKEVYNPYLYYYIIDKDKPITIDNITNEPLSIKKYLTEEQKKIFIECKQRKMPLRQIIKKYNLPTLSAMRFNKEYKEIYGDKEMTKTSKTTRKNSKIYLVDTELSTKFENKIDSITKDELQRNTLVNIVSDMCKDLGIQYTKSIYNKCYKYLNGQISSIIIYKEEIATKESSTTSL